MFILPFPSSTWAGRSLSGTTGLVIYRPLSAFTIFCRVSNTDYTYRLVYTRWYFLRGVSTSCVKSDGSQVLNTKRLSIAGQSQVVNSASSSEILQPYETKGRDKYACLHQMHAATLHNWTKPIVRIACSVIVSKIFACSNCNIRLNLGSEKTVRSPEHCAVHHGRCYRQGRVWPRTTWVLTAHWALFRLVVSTASLDCCYVYLNEIVCVNRDRRQGWNTGGLQGSPDS